MLASSGVCKKRLLKAELCFVALMFGCSLCQFIDVGQFGVRITIYSSDGICEVFS